MSTNRIRREFNEISVWTRVIHELISQLEPNKGWHQSKKNFWGRYLSFAFYGLSFPLIWLYGVIDLVILSSTVQFFLKSDHWIPRYPMATFLAQKFDEQRRRRTVQRRFWRGLLLFWRDLATATATATATSLNGSATSPESWEALP